MTKHSNEEQANSQKLRGMVEKDLLRIHNRSDGRHYDIFATESAADQLQRMGIATYEPDGNLAFLGISRDLSRYNRRVELRDVGEKIGQVNWENTFSGIRELPLRTKSDAVQARG